MKTLRLYLRSMAILLKSRLQYPASFLMQTAAQLIMEGGEFMAVLLIVDRFDSLNRYTPGNLYFFFGIMSVSFYITEFMGRGITGRFPGLVREGGLDTLLTRPRGVLTQVLSSDIDPRRIACIAVGVAALVMGSRLSGISWSFAKALLLAEAVLFSVFLVMGLFMIEAVFCIYSVKSVELVNVLTYGGRSACQYPMDIYPRPLRALFTIVAPFALTQHAPAAYILDKPLYNWPAWAAYVAPLSGLTVFAVMACAFHAALKHYRSTGS